ncbi:hypothetical protein MNBD_NITROSPINAE01-1432 [hydrothermal vent metagenome]|uniref:RmlD-like substrate binding domain-containing protein n=1 Tax=hydrothermal vent metagenome TaxID=652676 RepID=A0A3B1BYG3_9ZZZZ
MTTLEKTLIVGIESKIGVPLAADMRKNGQKFIGTTRRLGNKSLLYLDLTDSPETWDIPGGINSAVICAGVTNMEACAADPEYTARVNVSGPIALAERLMAQGAYVLFLSTNMVFGDSEKIPGPEEKPTPTTEYGRQKIIAEASILQLGERSAVLRMTKVFDPANRLITQWKVALKKNVSIKAFSDMYAAPTPVFCVTQAIKYLLASKAPGIWHLSGDRDISYVDIARAGALALGADKSLVKPVASPGEKVSPRRTIMDMRKLQEAAGIYPPTVDKTVISAFVEKESLADASAAIWRE